jgi:type IX secretion system PorP/SprF family membrane protein
MSHMTVKSIKLFILFLPAAFNASGQLLLPGLGFQSSMIGNPALAGSEGNGMLRLSYQDLYPGNNFNLHSVLLSYDGFFQSLHGGAGFYISDNYLGGVINDLKGGMAYSYFFRAGSDLFISAGLSASFFHRGLNAGEIILPDQIDPLYGAVNTSTETLSSRGKTVLDLGTGFLFISGNVFGGIAINHLTEPNLGTGGFQSDRVYRQVMLHASGLINLNSTKSLILRPLVKIEMSRGGSSAGAGAVLETLHLSISSALIAGNDKVLDIVSGFSISLGNMFVFYNYRYNIASGDKLLPLSVMHNTGIAFSLHNVDKRKTIKTINFPKL